MDRYLLVGGYADGLRLSVTEGTPYIDIAIPPKENLISPQMGDTVAEGLSFSKERYCIFSFRTPQGEVTLYAPENFTPTDVLNQLIKGYKKRQKTMGQ